MADTTTVTITINGVDHEATNGERLIMAAEKVGEYIPRFCHHDKLEAVAKCRMCLVEVEGPRGKALVPSCTVLVTEGMVVDTESDVVKKAQAGVLEFLLLNHPLDCSVCDKGGECPLQDQALGFGAGESRFIEEKRTFLKPIPVSDLVLLDRERCVLCDRCVRVADDIAGDPLIEFIDRAGSVQINTFPGEPFSSYFSGNTVQVCPVGALTSVDYRFKARPWDLETVRSVSLVDSVHSTVDVHTSLDEILRVYGVDNPHLNDGWLSDKDRFSFSAFKSDQRITTPLIREGEDFREASWPEAIELVASRLGSYIGTEVGAIGGALGTNEDAYTLGKFMRSVIGSPHVDCQVGDGLDPHFAAALRSKATINSLDSASAILLWGTDLKESLPVLYLRVRKAVKAGARLVIFSPWSTGLDGIATHVIRYRAGSGPDVLRRLTKGDDPYSDVAETLETGPVVGLVGRTSITEHRDLAESVAAHVLTLPDSSVLPLLTRANVFGALDMGLAPTLLPGRVSTLDEPSVAALESAWGPLPTVVGKDTPAILDALTNQDLRALLLIGADPITESPNPSVAIEAIETADFVVAIDSFLTQSSRRADVLLPSAPWGEVDGTVTNLEGRVQRLCKSIEPRGRSLSVHAILDAVATSMGASMSASDWRLINKEISTTAPAYEGITADYLTFECGIEGALAPLPDATQPLGHVPVATQVAVVNERFTLHFAPAMYDAGLLVTNAEVLADLVVPASARMNPKDASALAIEDGSTVNVSGHDFPLIIDPDVPERSIVLPHNHESTRTIVASPGVAVTNSGGGS